MLIPVRCTCGKSIGAYYAVFVLLRQKRLEKILNKKVAEPMPQMLILSDDMQPVVGDILDAMNIHKTCCRQKMLTSCNFSDFY